MRSAERKLGVVLVMVLAVMLLIASAMAILAHSAVGIHETRKRAQMQRSASLLLDSGEAYVAAHKDEWAEVPPTEPITPDLTGMLRPPLSGKLTITFESSESGRLCSIRAHVTRHRLGTSEMRKVQLD